MSRLRRWIQTDAGLSSSASLRVILGQSMSFSWRTVLAYSLAALVYLAVLLALGATVMQPTGTPSQMVFQALYLPTVIGQAIVSAAAFALTLYTIDHQRRRQTWDHLRVTAGGTRELLRATWAAVVYHRLRGLFGIVVYAPRIVLLGLLLYDLTAFRGEYLIMIADSHIPKLLPLLEILLLGALITAAFLLPFSAVGLEAAVGLLLAASIRRRSLIVVVHILLVAGRFVWGVFPALLLRDLLTARASAQIPDPLTGILTLIGGGLAGDWGLAGLQITAIDSLWTHIPYSAYGGVILLGGALLHTALTAAILRWSVHHAQHSE